MQLNHTLKEEIILSIIKKSYELLPNIKDRTKTIAWKLKMSLPETEYYISLYKLKEYEQKTIQPRSIY